MNAFTGTDADSAPIVDAHAHVFCWGENPEDGYLCEKIRRSLITRFVMRMLRLDHEPGDECHLHRCPLRMVLQEAGTRSLGAASLQPQLAHDLIA